MKLHGIIPALITPFDEYENVDFDGFCEMLDFVIDAGVHAVFVSGSTGESYAMSVDERIELTGLAIRHIAGKVPVGAGTGANSTRDVVRLCVAAEESGCDYVSVITPTFITPSVDQLYDHFAAAAETVSIPILLYGNPARTQNRLPASLVARLARAYPNIRGIKDSSGDLQQFAAYVRECPEGFWSIMGNDAMVLAGLQYGAVGAICATANIVPGVLVQLYESFMAGDIEEALHHQKLIIPLREAFALGSFPAMLKHATRMLGLPSGRPRRPIGWLTTAQEEHLVPVLESLGCQIVNRCIQSEIGAK